MALVLADRVKETTTTAGSGTITLAGAATGFQSFAVVGNANTTYYCIAGGAEWEVGIGTYTAAGTLLSRDTVLASSNAGSLVSFSAGTKDVFVTYPSSRSVYADGTTLQPTNSAILPIAFGGTGATTLANAAIATYTGTETLTNKRINPRVSTTTSTATLTPDISAFDQYNLTAQAVDLTIAAPNGTPVDGNKIIFRFLDNGTGRALTWNATYTPVGQGLPTTTILNKILYVGCIYNAANTRWDVVAVVQQA